METALSVNVVLADCPHGSCKRTFFKPGRRPCVLVWTANLNINPATSHNNNNGRLHACVRAAEVIEPVGLPRQNILLLCHYAE